MEVCHKHQRCHDGCNVDSSHCSWQWNERRSAHRQTLPTSITPGWLSLNFFNAWDEVSNQRANCSKSVVSLSDGEKVKTRLRAFGIQPDEFRSYRSMRS